MNNKGFAICLILFFSMIFTSACQLDTEGDALFAPSNGDAADSSEVDSSTWPETGVPDADASPDTLPEATPDSPEDVVPDIIEDAQPEADAPEDAPEDVTEEDSAVDAPEDVVEADAPPDAPPDVVEADAPNPVDCFGVPTESGHVMICGNLPGGTGKSLMFKAEINSSGSGQSIPFKSVCWSEVGVAELACFPCPGPDICWPIPGGGFSQAVAHMGDVIKFQPGIADAPGLDMKNTLCELGKCYQGSYIVYSGHTEVCRVNTDATLEGNATYEGSGTDVKIVCTL